MVEDWVDTRGLSATATAVKITLREQRTLMIPTNGSRVEQSVFYMFLFLLFFFFCVCVCLCFFCFVLFCFGLAWFVYSFYFVCVCVCVCACVWCIYSFFILKTFFCLLLLFRFWLNLIFALIYFNPF